ncbi:type 1 fimbrial protein [Ideonella sp. 4Y16]|uniref:Type 1 fimbrial protein n=1 Tax=Ideonella aquatica TaxID=2824119 RepID=A0A940YWA4_9BURK|nr:MULTISPECIES: fimbrial protein [Ideonella]MBQ0946161.1 type 1 fimbrial protein [Ideonella alba]MBQ0960415.1 type 1 fimbrial protein [Ideonella aquatica]
MMHKPQLLSAAALALVLASSAASAADGTVTINGSVSAETCTISGNGGGSPNFTLTLPTVAKSALATAGQTAGQTAFTIGVSACTGTATSMNTYFEPGSGSVNASGRVGNTGTAANVDVQITTAAGGVVNMAANNGSQGTTATNLSGGAATQTYNARYYATGVATSGSFSGTFSYSLVYN